MEGTKKVQVPNVVQVQERGRKTWGECVSDGMELLGMQPEYWIGNFQRCAEEINMSQTSNPSSTWKKWTFSKDMMILSLYTGTSL